MKSGEYGKSLKIVREVLLSIKSGSLPPKSGELACLENVHKNLPISQMEGYFENPYLVPLFRRTYAVYDGFKMNLLRVFSSIKTKTNSNLLVKLDERRTIHFYFYVMNQPFQTSVNEMYRT